MDFSEKFKFCPACGSEHFIINNFKSKRCENCGFIYYFNPSSAAAAFILNKNNDLLLCRRASEPAKGTLDLPGGFIDYNETGEEGIEREVMEEIGVELKNLKYLFSLPNDYTYSDLNIPTLDMFYEGEIAEDVVLKANDDVSDSFYLPLNEVDPTLFGLKSVKKAVQMFLTMQSAKI